MHSRVAERSNRLTRTALSASSRTQQELRRPLLTGIAPASENLSQLVNRPRIQANQRVEEGISRRLHRRRTVRVLNRKHPLVILLPQHVTHPTKQLKASRTRRRRIEKNAGRLRLANLPQQRCQRTRRRGHLNVLPAKSIHGQGRGQDDRRRLTAQAISYTCSQLEYVVDRGRIGPYSGKRSVLWHRFSRADGIVGGRPRLLGDGRHPRRPPSLSSTRQARRRRGRTRRRGA